VVVAEIEAEEVAAGGAADFDHVDYWHWDRQTFDVSREEDAGVIHGDDVVE